MIVFMAAQLNKITVGSTTVLGVLPHLRVFGWRPGILMVEVGKGMKLSAAF
jgi:hypothetical protein